ncbi:fructosamine kinase family protein [Kineococcus gynurae]|uniref:Fructosamine kinase family protein n=1 Tax=Kineococcus gynurae TaxID=452979 RepID=A0ABV5LPU0_9ACTN
MGRTPAAPGDPVHRKQVPGADPTSVTFEAAGLRWLAKAGGVRVVPLLDQGPDFLVLERVEHRRPSPAEAERFGRDLVRTHAAGAPAFGALPPGAGTGWIAALPLPPTPSGTSWGRFYARCRIAPFVRAGRDAGAFTSADVEVLDRVCARLEDEEEALVTGVDAPARLHGDLWSGNVLFGPEGAVLIDPSAHGGHPETDLAMLALFGAPHLDRVLAAYEEAAGTPPGRAARTPLHQLYPLLVHTVLFGGTYAAQTVRAARDCGAL